MKAKRIFVLLLTITASAAAQVQRPAVAREASPPPVLTLDDAVAMALGNNRLVKNSKLETEKFDFRVNTARSRRLPQFQFAVLAGELLHPFDFTVPAGVFGTYQNVGPIPAQESKIHTPARFTTYATGAFDQPLTQQYRIGLGIRMSQVGRELSREELRAERQQIAAEVRTAYFEMVSSQSGVDAAREVVTALEEAQRVTARYRLQEVVLKADALEVDARLAKSRYELSVAENGLATQREKLNELLGRDLNTPFRVDPLVEGYAEDMTLEAARKSAAENRPEIREALLKVKQAELDRRLAKADYIPDVSLSVRYQGINNVQVLPANVTTAGISLNWEPFDWGRRHNNVAEKAKTIQQAHNAAQETEAQIAVEVGAKHRKWEESTLLLKAMRATREATAEQLRVTLNKYREQAVLVRDVLEVQARSADSEFRYQEALSRYWNALADLRRAMGEE